MRSLITYKYHSNNSRAQWENPPTLALKTLHLYNRPRSTPGSRNISTGTLILNSSQTTWEIRMIQPDQRWKWLTQISRPGSSLWGSARTMDLARPNAVNVSEMLQTSTHGESMHHVYPILAKTLSKDHCKINWTIRIVSGTEGSGASKYEGVAPWGCIAASETTFSDPTVIKFECDIVIHVLISEIHLAKLQRFSARRSRVWIPMIIGINQVNGHWSTIWTRTAWQLNFEDGATMRIRTQGHPNLDATIRDREYTQAICVERGHIFSTESSTKFDELVRIINAISVQSLKKGSSTRILPVRIVFGLWPCKNALVVECAVEDGEMLSSFSIQHWHLHVQETHQRIGSGTRVISFNVFASVLLFPMEFQSLLKNRVSLGVIISCRVYPRENHSGHPPWYVVISLRVEKDGPETSWRYG